AADPGQSDPRQDQVDGGQRHHQPEDLVAEGREIELRHSHRRAGRIRGGMAGGNDRFGFRHDHASGRVGGYPDDGRIRRGWGGLLQKAEHILSLACGWQSGGARRAPPKSKEWRRDQAANSSSSATRNEKMPRASAKAMPMNSIAVCDAAAEGLRSAPDR